LTTQLFHLTVATLTRQTLEFTSGTTSFVNQLLLLSLIRTATAVCRLLHATTLFFKRAFLPASKFLETSFSF